MSPASKVNTKEIELVKLKLIESNLCNIIPNFKYYLRINIFTISFQL